MQSLYYTPRRVKKVDIGTMSIRQVNKYINELKVKAKLYDVSDEEPKRLSDLPKTAQILLKYKLKVDNEREMGQQSKLFFRLWRFVFRHLQRQHGFEEDIMKYDEFVKEFTPLRIEGDFVYVKRKPSIMARAINFHHEFSSRTKEWPSPPPKKTDLIRNPHEFRRYVQKFRAVIRMTDPPVSEVMDVYRGVCIRDEELIEGMIKILLVWEDRLTRQQFNRGWEILSLINGTSINIYDFWKSNWGWLNTNISKTQLMRDITFHPSVGMGGAYHPSPGMDDKYDIFRIDAWELNGSKLNRFDFSKDVLRMMMTRLHDTKFDLAKIPREEYSPLQEYMFREMYYYPRKQEEPEFLLPLPLDLHTTVNLNEYAHGEMLSSHEAEQMKAYRARLKCAQPPTPEPPVQCPF